MYLIKVFWSYYFLCSGGTVTSWDGGLGLNRWISPVLRPPETSLDHRGVPLGTTRYVSGSSGISRYRRVPLITAGYLSLPPGTSCYLRVPLGAPGISQGKRAIDMHMYSPKLTKEHKCKACDKIFSQTGN